MTRSVEIETLIGRVAKRDRRALTQLYAATSAQLFAVVSHVLKGEAAAQIALQDTYMKVWHAADRFQDSGLGEMTWLLGIARTIALDRMARTAEAAVNDARDEDLVAQVYWRGAAYPALAARHGLEDGAMRAHLRNDLAALQVRLMP